MRRDRVAGLSSGAWRAATLTLAMLAATPMAVAKPWHVHYQDALDLRAKGDAPGAERELREALTQRADSACHARSYGVLFHDYFPHYQLGVALQAQGRDAEAALELSRELAAGAISDCPAAAEARADLEARLEALALGGAAKDDSHDVVAPAVVTAPVAQEPAAQAPPADASAPAGDESRASASATSPALPAERRLTVHPPPRLPALLGVDWSASLGLPPTLLPARRP